MSTDREMGPGGADDATSGHDADRADDERQRLAALGKLAIGIAHDFNNFLTVIGASAELAAADTADTATVGEALQRIRQATTRASALTQQLLQFAQRQPAAQQPIELGPIVSEIGLLLARLVDDDIEVLVQSRPDTWTVLADLAQVEQVVMNLAMNARDAMPAGGRLELSVANVAAEAAAADRPELAPGEYVELAVTDTGSGIPAEMVAAIFHPFVTTKGSGRGVGLATVREIMERHRGHIAVTSGPDGTVFRLCFPRHHAEAVPRPTDEGSAPPPGIETVMLVEDELDVRRVIGLILRGLGYALVEAETPQAALEWAADPDRRLDLLLTDVKMPGIDGIEVAARIREHRPLLPVLLMSGYTDQSIDALLASSARCAFIQKPFTREVLARRIRALLDPVPAGRTAPAPTGREMTRTTQA